MTDRLVEELEAEARYHRERLALYRAKVYGSAPTSAVRLRKLEQASDYAERRLRRVQRQVHTLSARAPRPFQAEES
jgi:predicted  nucleic acid-binding Zn-ribbon protein